MACACEVGKRPPNAHLRGTSASPGHLGSRKTANVLRSLATTQAKMTNGRGVAGWHANCFPESTMRNPLLLTSAAALTCLALNACGGSNEPAKSPDDSERAADKAEDAADKAEDKADKAADKAEEAADKATDTK